MDIYLIIYLVFIPICGYFTYLCLKNENKGIFTIGDTLLTILAMFTPAANALMGISAFAIAMNKGLIKIEFKFITNFLNKPVKFLSD